MHLCNVMLCYVMCIMLAALKFCFKTCVAMKFVDDDDDDDLYCVHCVYLILFCTYLLL